MTIIIIFLVLILSFSLPNSNVYDLSPNVPSNITNILGENIYHLFISNITRFHRINITMILKTHAWFTGFNEKEITFKEFQSRTDDYYSYISENIPNYYKNPSYISEDHKVILYNFFYDIKNNTVLALVLYPWHDQIYLYINITVEGDLIEFEDNHSIKTYTNLKWFTRMGEEWDQFCSGDIPATLEEMKKSKTNIEAATITFLVFPKST